MVANMAFVFILCAWLISLLFVFIVSVNLVLWPSPAKSICRLRSSNSSSDEVHTDPRFDSKSAYVVNTGLPEDHVIQPLVNNVSFYLFLSLSPAESTCQSIIEAGFFNSELLTDLKYFSKLTYIVHCAFHVTPCSNVYNASPVLLWVRPSGSVPFRPRRFRSLWSSLIAFLLLTVESNPGPQNLRFGSLNARSAVHKAALIRDLIHDKRLDILAVCESWIVDDAPDAIKNDIAPFNYSVLHTHRSRVAGRSRKGGGLALIYNKDIIARPVKIAFVPTSFELQLVGVQVGHITVKLANVYRPPMSSKSTFLDEFTEMITRIEQGYSDKLIICSGDFNMPGVNSNSIDDLLSTLLEVHSSTSLSQLEDKIFLI